MERIRIKRKVCVLIEKIDWMISIFLKIKRWEGGR